MSQSDREGETAILVVDDDAETRHELEEYLSDHGFRVGSAGDGEAMRRCMAEQDYGLVIMDLKLPGEDGLSLTRYIRAQSRIPVIMLTGRGETIDRVIGLEMGADDYITKPFEPRELVARIRTVLRRVNQPAAAQPADQRNVVSFEGWRLDLDSRALASADGADAKLTTAEFKLLEAFVTRPKRVLERDFLLDVVHGREYSFYDRSIDNLVARLRRKIEADPGDPRIIKSVRGAGYLFAADVKRG